VKNNVRSKKKSKRSRGIKRLIVAGVFLTVIVLAVWSLVRGWVAAVMPERGIAAAVPVRTTPAPAPWTPAQIARLRHALDGAFSPALSDRYSLAVIDAGGRVIYANRERDAVTPASVQKLIVANAALDLLGARYRFHTILAATQAPKDGTLDGNLWLVGSGDPSFTSDDLRRGVRQLARAGLRRIDGDVAIDAGAMTGPEINPHWDPNDAGEDFQAPVSAVSLDGDTIEIAPNVWIPAHDMPVVVGDVLERMLRHAGIEAQRRIAGRAPLDSIVLWDHASAPLRLLVGHMLFLSDNHYAEQLLRTLALDAGERGDDANGLAVERRFLSERGIPTDGMRIVDGSGLAESDRVAAITLARILSDAQLRDGGSELYMLLPGGGRDGTLTDYDFTTAYGRVRAKTGHLSDANSLAGYVTTMHHGRVSFAFLINNSPGDPDAAYVRAIDRLATF